MCMVTSAPDAFLSYTRFDDQHDGGAISAFRLRLESAVRAVTGQPFEIFQDIDGIGLGERWSDKLDQILDQARFFMPIITPNYFTSAACRDELEKFLHAEAGRGRADLVLPIYYIECDVLEDPELRVADPLALAIHGRQRQDWRDLRFEPFDAKDVRLARERLAREISRVRRGATPPAPRRSSVTRQPATLRSEVERLRPGTIFRDIDAPWCPEMVVLPRGGFVMGSPGDEHGRHADERPRHEVRIGYDLAVGRDPVTFEQYDRFAEASGADMPRDEGWGRGQRPVINVSWEDAKAYAAWLGSETGKPYRLPSEAEWEYACRAGTTSRYWWGDDSPTPEQAAFDMDRSTEVGAYPPNPWGLCDMHGNVWDWVEDCWNESYAGAPDDGSAWTSGDCSRRVLRGGSWGDRADALCSSGRNRYLTALQYLNIGFRVARTLG